MNNRVNRLAAAVIFAVSAASAAEWLGADRVLALFGGAPGDYARAVHADLSAADRALYDRILQEAQKRRVAAVDARVDRVWKAIPGYNGLEVDVDQTFELARRRPEGAIPFVFKEIAPNVQLRDLGAYPVYKGNPNKPMISLMINVAWGNEYIPAIIAILNNENVHATFFFDGSWLQKNVVIAKQIGSFGHELSNHGYSHKNMSGLSRTAATQEIVKTQHLLERELDIRNTLFAPPSGDYDAETVQIAGQLGLTTVLWTIDTLDWRKPEPAWIVRRVASRLEPGAMILMHPTAASAAALASVIHEGKRRGFVFGTVSELLSSSRVPPLDNAAISLLDRNVKG